MVIYGERSKLSEQDYGSGWIQPRYGSNHKRNPDPNRTELKSSGSATMYLNFIMLYYKNKRKYLTLSHGTEIRSLVADF